MSLFVELALAGAVLAITLLAGIVWASRESRRSQIGSSPEQPPSHLQLNRIREALKAVQDSVDRIEARLERGLREQRDQPASPIFQAASVDVDHLRSAPPGITREADSATGIPVDLVDDGFVISNSLTAIGLLIPEPGRPSKVYINSEVEVDHVAFAVWARAFEFADGAAYRRFRTVEPALTDLVPPATAGRIVRKGIAHAQ